MNIKLKALLIAVSLFIGFFGAFSVIVMYPVVLLLAVFGGLVYFVYRGVLSQLEYNKKYKK